MTTSNEKSIATLIHLSSLTQYFIPFGNYIFPIILWSSKKNDSEFIDYHGKQVINFQLSILLYSVLLCLISIPIIIYTFLKNVDFNAFYNDCDVFFNNINFSDISGTVILAILALTILGVLKVMEFFIIIYAALKASNGEKYNYPLTINFFK